MPNHVKIKKKVKLPGVIYGVYNLANATNQLVGIKISGMPNYAKTKGNQSTSIYITWQI